MLTRRIFSTTILLLTAAGAYAQGKKGAVSGMGSSGGSGAAPDTPAQVLNVAGRYAARGRNEDGSAYDGEVQITQNGTKIRIQWRIGQDSYSGEGLIDGRIVAVDWGSSSPVVYVVMPDGELHGTWGDGLGLEKLAPM